jgi:LysR family transcriptional regulator, regulator for metE and metH
MNLIHDAILELRHLRLVRAVASEGNLVRAAPVLHLTQSALSHQLFQLEQTVGLPLFTRTRKRMQLTPAGKRVLATADAVFDELHATGRDLAAMHGTPADVLRVSTECTTCYHWLPAVVASFSKRFPSVEVEINIEASRRPIAALLSGELDAAVVYSARKDRRLALRDLFKDELVIIVSPEHRLAGKPHVEPRDFAGEVLLYYGGVDDESTLARHILSPAGVHPRKLLKVPLTEAIIEMVKAQHGVSMIPSWSARPYVEAGELIALPLTRRGVFREWKLAMRAGNETCDYLIEFGNLLAGYSAPAKTWRDLRERSAECSRGGRVLPSRKGSAKPSTKNKICAC